MAITTPVMQTATTQNATATQMTPAQMAAAQAQAAQMATAQAQAAQMGSVPGMQAANAGQAQQAAIDQIKLGELERIKATTSAEQLQGILNKGGALMQQSAAAGRAQATSRGLLNSTMGIQAAQNAMIQNASPLAQFDA